VGGLAGENAVSSGEVPVEFFFRDIMRGLFECLRLMDTFHGEATQAPRLWQKPRDTKGRSKQPSTETR